MDRDKRIWYLSPMRAAKVQASLRIRAVSPEPSLLAHTSSESRGTFRQKARSLVPLNGWTCAVTICHDGMLEDTNSLDGAHIIIHYLKHATKTGFGLLVRVDYLNYSNPVSFFLFLWSVYTLLGAIKRYGLKPENKHFQCLDTVLTLARTDAHA